MDKEKFLSWKDHPQTVEFFEYLKDYRNDLMERWAQGSLRDADNTMAIARAQMADEIVNLEADAISQFYQQRKEVNHEQAENS